ncbi:MAG: hypothetical protein RI911_129 [Candidatus Parcubacteria bacterium]|jgi:putative oxidoreductase
MFGAYSDYVQAIARVLLASIFLVTGLGVVFGGAAAFNGFQGMVAQTGVPMVGLVTVLVVALKVFGGAALALGFKARYVALVLAVFTALTIVLVHSPATWNDPAYGTVNFLMAIKNLSIIGGLLLIANNGAGAMALRCNSICTWCK